MRGDIAAILSLERATASATHWSENAYLDLFAPDAPGRIAIVLETAGPSLGGFVVARLIGGECELENLAVARHLQRQGAGTQLMHSLFAATRERQGRGIFLEVRESNRAARALYERCGFKITGCRRQYYSSPLEDSVLYALLL
jgi:ribosomal-protein-alanine N-acetyltransferase